MKGMKLGQNLRLFNSYLVEEIKEYLVNIESKLSCNEFFYLISSIEFALYETPGDTLIENGLNVYYKVNKDNTITITACGCGLSNYVVDESRFVGSKDGLDTVKVRNLIPHMCYIPERMPEFYL